MTQRYYSNVSKVMSLQVGINNSATSVTVDDASGLPSSYPFNIAIDYGAAAVEIVSCTNVASNVLTVVRGQEDTAAASHDVGAVVVHPFTALDAQDANDHIQKDTGVHGLDSGSHVVGTTFVQTLSQKTMSGLNNTFTNISRTSLTGSENNLAVGQSNAASPALTITPNATPTTDIISATYWKMDQNGITRLIGKSAGADVLRIYDTAGTTIRAKITEAGAGTFIGLTSTGLINANAGVNVPSGQTLTIASGGTLAVASGATFTTSGTATVTFGSDVSHSIATVATFSGTVNLNATVSFGAASTVTFNNGFTVPSGESATIASGGTLNSASGSTATLNGDISRDSATGRLLMDFVSKPMTSSASAAGAANSIQDIGGATYTFTVPANRTAVVKATSTLNILGVAATTASFELLLNVDGSNWTSLGPILTTTSAIQFDVSKAWVVTGLTAGSHTIKLQYKNINGNTTNSIQGGDSRTGMELEIFW